MESKVCKACGESKPLVEFWTGRTKCKVCMAKYHAEWREKNRGAWNAAGLKNYHKRMAEMPQEQKQTHRKQRAAYARERNAMLKAEVYAGYGGYRCQCCGEAEPMFLSIDHVNNDGYTQRKNGQGSGANLYNMLYMEFKRTGKWPDGYQVLCMNCQHGKARNHGVCPHCNKV